MCCCVKTTAHFCSKKKLQKTGMLRMIMLTGPEGKRGEMRKEEERCPYDVEEVLSGGVKKGKGQSPTQSSNARRPSQADNARFCDCRHL